MYVAGVSAANRTVRDAAGCSLDINAAKSLWPSCVFDRPMDRFEQGAAFWTTVTGTRLSPRRGADGEFATLLPPEGDACLKLQGVRDIGGAHLDLEVEDVRLAENTAADLGAALVDSHADWTVMRSPGGQLFCLLPWAGAATRPPVAVSPDGTSSRLDQVCIDVAPASYDAEVAFWRALTGWEFHRGALPEFSVLKPPSAPADPDPAATARQRPTHIRAPRPGLF